TLGKIIGGGLPVGAYGGRKEIMDLVAPAGPVYQAGTLSGNPVAMAAGLETLKILREKNPYPLLNRLGQHLAQGLTEAANKAGVAAQVERAGSMLTFFFTKERIINANSARSCDTQKFGRFFRGMLEKGIYLAPSQFEACFISAAHSEKDIEKTLEAAREVLSTSL
ncbi:MAG: aminotransferase class III-fold pyridoxal phosphate-dependent enzyme, partial [Deltaproteobacteria bacterium]|nr:aminotransferase class III-fold pyridoxal phosphate-dependent enzyme [Deltaproteobacteria bacterium]